MNFNANVNDFRLSSAQRHVRPLFTAVPITRTALPQFSPHLDHRQQSCFHLLRQLGPQGVELPLAIRVAIGLRPVTTVPTPSPLPGWSTREWIWVPQIVPLTGRPTAPHPSDDVLQSQIPRGHRLMEPPEAFRKRGEILVHPRTPMGSQRPMRSACTAATFASYPRTRKAPASARSSFSLRTSH